MMTDPASSYHLFEEAVEKHARLIGEARILLARIKRDPGNTKHQERLLKVLRSFRVIRARLENQGRRLASVDEALLGNAATLLEYMLLVGLEEELDIVSRAYMLSGEAELLSKEAELLSRDKDSIRSLLRSFAAMLDGLAENGDQAS